MLNLLLFNEAGQKDKKLALVLFCTFLVLTAISVFLQIKSGQAPFGSFWFGVAQFLPLFTVSIYGLLICTGMAIPKVGTIITIILLCLLLFFLCSFTTTLSGEEKIITYGDNSLTNIKHGPTGWTFINPFTQRIVQAGVNFF
ncbi:hypothetical protein KKF61_06275 [Patescibacteria group bacterium]|nr:hypothetical protein [Patescibacteria group bacterium]MBU0963896.1 hypothetical protein [Patescibacteria group bacterium]